MAEKDIQWGIIILIIATFFLLAGLDLLRFDIIRSGSEGISVFIAFVLVAVGVYLVAKK